MTQRRKIRLLLKRMNSHPLLNHQNSQYQQDTKNRQQPFDRLKLYQKSVEENLRRKMAALGRGGMGIGEDSIDQPNTPPNRDAATPDNQNQGETSAKSISEIKAGEANVSIGETIQHNTNIHYHFGSFSQYQQLAPTLLSGNMGEGRVPNNTSNTSMDNTDPLQSKFTETFASTSPGTAFVNPEIGSVIPEAQLPDPLDEWYYNTLNEREQCFVQVAAVLHGAPVHEVSRIASELYSPLRRRRNISKLFFYKRNSNHQKLFTLLQHGQEESQAQLYWFIRILLPVRLKRRNACSGKMPERADYPNLVFAFFVLLLERLH